MKLPDAFTGLNKEKLIELLVQYGDKAVLALVLLFSCGLAWGGIDALRSKSVSASRQPKAIEQAASMAESHINQLQSPPQSVRVRPEPLATKVEPWQSPKLVPATLPPLFDAPLFEELAKRTKPNVLPIEQLQATAGIAVLAVADRPMNPGVGAAALPPGERERPGEREKPGAGRRGAKRGEPNPAEPFGGFGADPRGGPGEPPGLGAEPPRGRITPFVVVTGLVPYDKQVEEYQRKFAQTSYPDPKRDTPIWSEYLVERTEVKPGGQENWQRIDLKMLAKKARDEWAGIQGETLPPGMFMPAGGGGVVQGGPAQPAAASFASYCLPLPQLAAGSWGPETIHSSFLDAVKEAWAKQAAAGPAAPTQPGLEVSEEQAPARPDFTSPEEQGEGGLRGIPPGLEGQFGPGAIPGEGMQPVGLPYRLFRFVDTTVQMGRSYRYRVRLSVWNPNWKLPARHLNDPAIAVNDRLASNPSEPSAAVKVPTTTAVLARSLSKADMKRFKPGMLEALVIGESGKTGNYSLRSVITELGGLVNVDSRLNKPGDTRARGEDIQTNAVVIDVHGRQQDRAEERAGGRSPIPPEPFELLVMEPDGAFAVASVADSQEVIERNLATLPVIEAPAKPGPTGPPGFGPPGFPPPGFGPAPGGQPAPKTPF